MKGGQHERAYLSKRRRAGFHSRQARRRHNPRSNGEALRCAETFSVNGTGLTERACGSAEIVESDAVQRFRQGAIDKQRGLRWAVMLCCAALRRRAPRALSPAAAAPT